METLSSAVSSGLSGSGAERFLHRLAWHVASVLGIAWMVGLSEGNPALRTVAGWADYLGLPEAARNVPMEIHDWLLARPGVEPVLLLVALVGFLVHVRPWGDDWTDAAMSPAGASFILAFVLACEYPGPVAPKVGGGLALLVGALVVKCLAQGPCVIPHALVGLLLTWFYTPARSLIFLFTPAQESRSLSVQVAENSRQPERSSP